MKFKIEFSQRGKKRQRTIVADDLDAAEAILRQEFPGHLFIDFVTRLSEPEPGAGGNLTTAVMKDVFPPAVFERVKELQASHSTRNCTFRMKSPGDTLYLEEDARYETFKDDGQGGQKLGSIHMAGEWNMTATSIQGASGRVGDRVPVAPGTWVIETGFFMGKFLIHVFHWGIPSLTA